MYAVICDGVITEKQVTKVQCIPPFESAAAADTWAAKCKALFPDWTYKTVPIREIRTGVYEVKEM